MKKLLLLLFILLNLNGYSQLIEPLVNYCGDATFDLTLADQGQNISSFHMSQSDAVNNINAIVNPTNYTSVSSPQIIFARLQNSNAILPFNLIVNSYLYVDLTFTLDIPSSTAMALVNGGQDSSYTYQWSINGIVIPNETNESIIITSLPNNSVLTVNVIDANGCSGSASTQIMTEDGVINANDDAGFYTGLGGGVAYTNVLQNDTLNGVPVLPSEVIVSMVSTTNPGVMLSGLNVIIAAGTPVGVTY